MQLLSRAIESIYQSINPATQSRLLILPTKPAVARVIRLTCQHLPIPYDPNLNIPSSHVQLNPILILRPKPSVHPPFPKPPPPSLSFVSDQCMLTTLPATTVQANGQKRGRGPLPRMREHTTHTLTSERERVREKKEQAKLERAEGACPQAPQTAADALVGGIFPAA